MTPWQIFRDYFSNRIEGIQGFTESLDDPDDTPNDILVDL